MLSSYERERYDRQIMMDEIGETGQRRLRESRVAVVGAGGLGSSVATYLALAGIGAIRIIDHDVVTLSNLNRQTLHGDEDLGRRKVDSAREKLAKLNPNVGVEGVYDTVTEENVSSLLEGCDAIVDALDNIPTRLVVNRYAVSRKVALFHGAVRGFEGRAMTVVPGTSACLRCLYRGSPPPEKFPIIGTTPAVIGSIQATEAIKYLLGIGDLLTNQLLIYDGLRMRFETFAIERNPACDHCGASSDASASQQGAD